MRIKLHLNGFKFFYETFTALSCKKFVYLMGGAFQNMESWDRYIRFFNQRNIGVIVADLPGTGSADILPSNYGYDFLSQCIKAILDDCNLGSISLIATSYSVPYAMRFAETYPERVNKLILNGAFRQFSEKSALQIEYTLNALESETKEHFILSVLGEIGPGKGHGILSLGTENKVEKHKLIRRILFKQLSLLSEKEKELYMHNTIRLLENIPIKLEHHISCPTLLCTGEYDIFTPCSQFKDLAATIKDPKIVKIEKADHLSHLEREAFVSNLWHDFISHQPHV